MPPICDLQYYTIYKIYKSSKLRSYFKFTTFCLCINLHKKLNKVYKYAIFAEYLNI